MTLQTPVYQAFDVEMSDVHVQDPDSLHMNLDPQKETCWICYQSFLSRRELLEHLPICRILHDLPERKVSSPIAKSNHFGKPMLLRKTSFSEWSLPGHGERYADCGDMRFRGCLNGENHHGEAEGKAFVKAYRHSCDRKECPVCYESWAGAEADRATNRFLTYCVGRDRARELQNMPHFTNKDREARAKAIEAAFRHESKKGRLIHVIVSPPQDSSMVELEEWRVKLYRMAKRCGLVGGCVIFHAQRENPDGTWRDSPHFHVLGFGWIMGTKTNYEKTGWVVKNARIRETVYGTLMYQLSHAGVHASYNVVTWMGALGFRKLFVEKLRRGVEFCPLCGHEIEELLWVGGVDRPPPPAASGDFYMSSEGWERGSYRRMGDEGTGHF